MKSQCRHNLPLETVAMNVTQSIGRKLSARLSKDQT
jgi:hypothetical protein